MLNSLRRSDVSTRRSFLESLARTAMGVSILPVSESLFAASPAVLSAPARKAEHVIYLFMQGAMSHLDTFDPKPGTDAGGETTAIQTAVSGISIGNHLPQLAKQMNRLAVIRSMTTETGAHCQAA